MNKNNSNAQVNNEELISMDDLLKNDMGTAVETNKEEALDAQTDVDIEVADPKAPVKADKSKNIGIKYGAAAAVGVGVAAAGAYAVEGMNNQGAAVESEGQAEEAVANDDMNSAATAEEIENIITGGMGEPAEDDNDAEEEVIEEQVSMQQAAAEEVALEGEESILDEVAPAVEEVALEGEESILEEVAPAAEEVALEGEESILEEEAVLTGEESILDEVAPAAEEVALEGEESILDEEIALEGEESILDEEIALEGEESILDEEIALEGEESILDDAIDEVSDNVNQIDDSAMLHFDLNDVTLSHAVNDHMDFSQAFAAARADVGANGVFEWRGSVYGTFYEDEWNNVSDEYKEAFNNHDWTNEFNLADDSINRIDEEPVFLASGDAEPNVIDDDLFAHLPNEIPDDNTPNVIDDASAAAHESFDMSGIGHIADNGGHAIDGFALNVAPEESVVPDLVADSIDDFSGAYVLTDDPGANMIAMADDIIDVLPVDIAENVDIDVQVMNVTPADDMSVFEPMDNMLEDDVNIDSFGDMII